MKVVHLNIKKEDDLRDRVKITMVKQIKKKFFEPEGRTKLNILASHSCTKSNSIEQWGDS